MLSLENTYLYTEILPLAMALYIIGVLLKRIPQIMDWLIPWILLVLSCVASVMTLGCTLDAVIQGVLACGTAVLSNQLYKQTAQKSKS